MSLNHWVTGELVQAADFIDADSYLLDLIGAFATLLFGSGGGVNDTTNPLVATISSGNVINIGGGSQRCVVNGVFANEITAQAFSVPLNTGGSVRVDTIWVSNNFRDTRSFLRPVEQDDGTTPEQTCYEIALDLSMEYVHAGTGSPGAGWVCAFTLNVPPDSAALESGNIVANLLTFAQLLKLVAVSSINGEVGAIVLDSSDGSIVITATGETINLQAAAAAAAVASLDGLTGAVTLGSPSGSVSIGDVGEEITLDIAAAGFSSPDNSIAIGYDTGAKKITLGMNTGIGSSAANYGETSAGSGTAMLTMPDDAHDYVVFVEWAAVCHLTTPTIGSPSGGAVSGFAAVPGEGYTSGTGRASAACRTTGEGQTLEFPLVATGSSSGAYTNAGIWYVHAIAVS